MATMLLSSCTALNTVDPNSQMSVPVHTVVLRLRRVGNVGIFIRKNGYILKLKKGVFEGV